MIYVLLGVGGGTSPTDLGLLAKRRSLDRQSSKAAMCTALASSVLTPDVSKYLIL